MYWYSEVNLCTISQIELQVKLRNKFNLEKVKYLSVNFICL